MGYRNCHDYNTSCDVQHSQSNIIITIRVHIELQGCIFHIYSFLNVYVSFCNE